jgi:hypothetical protein
MSFTKEELEDLYKSQLCDLGEYYGIELDMKMLKEDMIEAIIEVSKPVEVAKEQPRSVRIQRIYESQE